MTKFGPLTVTVVDDNYIFTVYDTEVLRTPSNVDIRSACVEEYMSIILVGLNNTIIQTTVNGIA